MSESESEGEEGDEEYEKIVHLYECRQEIHPEVAYKERKTS